MLAKIKNYLSSGQILFPQNELPYLYQIGNNMDDADRLLAQKAYTRTMLILLINGMFKGVSADAADEADLPELLEIAANPGTDQEVSKEHIIRILKNKLAHDKLGTPFNPSTIKYLEQIHDDSTNHPDIRLRADLAIRVIKRFGIGLIGDVKRGGALKKSKRNKKRVRKTKKNK